MGDILRLLWGKTHIGITMQLIRKTMTHLLPDEAAS